MSANDAEMNRPRSLCSDRDPPPPYEDRPATTQHDELTSSTTTQQPQSEVEVPCNTAANEANEETLSPYPSTDSRSNSKNPISRAIGAVQSYKTRQKEAKAARRVDCTNWCIVNEFLLIVEGSGSFARWMHVTPSKQDVESLDRLDLLPAVPSGDKEGNSDNQAIENVIRWAESYESRPGTSLRVNAGGTNIISSDSQTHHRGVEIVRRSSEVDAMRQQKDAWYAHQVIWDTLVEAEKPLTHLIAGKIDTRGYLKPVGQSSSIRTIAEEPVTIRLVLNFSPAGSQTTGADIALVNVEVVDKDDHRCPSASNLVRLELLGKATWRGDIAQRPNNYILSTSLPVENGVNRVMLRSTSTAGEAKRTAMSDGLEPASITLKTKPFESVEALRLALPDDGLLADLSRGHIRVHAGGFAPQDSWIRHSLKESSVMSAVVLKLLSDSNLNVSVDDAIVWGGRAGSALSHVTICSAPTPGKRNSYKSKGSVVYR
ncbi:hypothetical protein QQS21_010306 [Conoideocrella luteorostrata]|uniref:Glycoside hydrolase family 2 domain-containing protein n=1 Tax=Conoideocrella luteorostrata TaxID=1105319 RepID=A0AAJ0FUU1_9HYPO|nr:hypothetical protein QQS21_010306 [Conoideocrella luteorostrata]